MKRGKLRTKALISLAIFTVMIALLTSVSLGFLYQSHATEDTRQEAAGYARLAAQMIDGDRIAGYLETGEKDEYYYEIQDFLDAAQENTDIWYYYVIVLDGDDVIYIWDAHAVEEGTEVGERDHYSKKSMDAARAELRQDPPEAMTVEDDPQYGYMATVYAPIYDSEENPVALVGVDMSMVELHKMARAFICLIVADILLVVYIFAAAFFVYIKKYIVDPVSELNDSAQNMVAHLESEEQFAIDIRSNDEIEELAESFKSMYTEVHDYIQQLEKVTKERERMGTELHVAKRIQAAMLPSIFPPFPQYKQFDIYASMTPAKEVGGDFYDFFMLDNTHLGIVMADVSGKGVPAALFMVIAKTLLKQRARVGGYPSEVLAEVNTTLCENNRIEMFVTVWLGILNINTGKLTAANAGHEYPVLQRAGGAYELIKDRHGFVLAGMDGVKYHDYEIDLQSGDRLFLYTDGIPEATNANNELFGNERMLAALNSNTTADCKQVLSQVREHVDAFVQEALQFDDMTMLCLEYRGING